MKIILDVILREQFGLEQKEKNNNSITPLSYASLLRHVNGFFPEGRDLEIVASEGFKSIDNEESWASLKEGAHLVAVFHSRSIKTKVTVSLPVSSGNAPKRKEITVEHASYDELENKVKTKFTDETDRAVGKGIAMVMIRLNGSRLFLDSRSYALMRKEYEVEAVLCLRKIKSKIKYVAVHLDDVKATLPNSEKEVSYSSFWELCSIISKRYPNNAIIDIFIGDTYEEVNERSIYSIENDTDIRVELDFRGIAYNHMTKAGSFLDTASAFQQQVLTFKATPRGPSCDRRMRTAP